MKKIIALLLTVIMPISALPCLAADAQLDTRQMIELVNDFWISEHSSAPGYSWDNAAYYVGNNEAYFTTGIEAYREYSLKWAEKNQWSGHRESDSSKWNNSNVYHADNEACFQVYADLYSLDGDYDKIARAIEVVGTQITADKNDYWWWCDALFMAMPVMAKLYRITGDEKYADKLYGYFKHCRDRLYDREAMLFFRDSGYLSSKINGQKNFWARGNGWVFAGLALVLRDMPEAWKYRDYFLGTYLDMAESIAASQKIDASGNGFWTQSMLADYPLADYNPEGYETSGTAFMTYGLLYGINAGFLSEQKYIDAALRGVSYIKNKAVRSDGFVGYCQEIGAAASKASRFEATQNYAVGAVLLALCELYRLEGGMTADLQPYTVRRLSNAAVFKLGGNYYYSNAAVNRTEASPFFAQSVYVPLRAAAEALGFSVGWNNGEVTVGNSLISTELKNGSKTVYIDSVPSELSSAACMAGRSLCVPLDFFELLGKETEVKGDLVYIGYKKRNFLSCEAAAENVLLDALTAGAFPVREPQPERRLAPNIPELNSPDRIAVVSASAKSIPEQDNPPENAFDGDPSTRYAATDFDAVFDLGEVKYVGEIKLSFWKYSERSTRFAVSVSTDGTDFERLYSGQSALGERFVNVSAGRGLRYIRVEGFGNTQGDWTSLLEIVPMAK